MAWYTSGCRPCAVPPSLLARLTLPYPRHTQVYAQGSFVVIALVVGALVCLATAEGAFGRPENMPRVLNDAADLQPARSRTAFEVALGGSLLPMPILDPLERLPTTLEQVDVSVMLRAEGGEESRVRVLLNAAQSCGAKHNLAIEVLVHDALGTAASWLGLAGNRTYIVAAPPTDPAHAINQLARLARGRVLVYAMAAVAEDGSPSSCAWLGTKPGSPEAQPRATGGLCTVGRAAFLRAPLLRCGSSMCTLVGHCDWGSAASSASAGPPPASMTAAGTPPRVAFLITYWGGSGRTKRHMATLTTTIVPRLLAAATLAGVEVEVLVNIDSRHIRHGDLATLASGGFLRKGKVRALLSPNVHELRAYNRLALLTEAHEIVLLQDDMVPTPAADHWLQAGLATLDANPTVANVGFKAGMYWASWWFNDDGEGAAIVGGPQGQVHVPKTVRDTRCKDRQTGLGIEAVRCVDLGPLVVRRDAFWAVGGLNETVTDSGSAGSVYVDCDLSARLYLHGMGSVVIGFTETWPVKASDDQFPSSSYMWAEHFTAAGIEHVHAAWDQPNMGDAHRARQVVFANRYEVVGSAFVAINKALRETNGNFKCYPEQKYCDYDGGCIKQWKDQNQPQCIVHDRPKPGLTGSCWTHPWSTMDCGLTEQEGTCESAPLLRAHKPEVLQDPQTLVEGCRLRQNLLLPTC